MSDGAMLLTFGAGVMTGMAYACVLSYWWKRKEGR